SEKDKAQALENTLYQLIKEYELLLNTISATGFSEEERKLIIANSYTSGSGQQIFLDKNVIIESDINPNESKQNIKDDNVKKYLRDFALFYSKSENPTVSFNKIEVVGKFSEELIQVNFESVFSGFHILKEKKYQASQRMVLVKLVPDLVNKWKPLIVAVGYNAKAYIYSENKNKEQVEDTIQSLEIIKYINKKKALELIIAANEEQALHVGISYSHFFSTNVFFSFQLKYGSGNNYRDYVYNSLYNSLSINYLFPVKFIKNLYLGLGTGGVIALDDINGRLSEGERAGYYPGSSNGLQFILRPELRLSDRFSININANQMYFFNAGDMIGRERFHLGIGGVYFL
ncbi:MAG: hypothetical protein AAGI07_06555, partial [Bacteroidota bacterium]